MTRIVPLLVILTLFIPTSLKAEVHQTTYEFDIRVIKAEHALEDFRRTTGLRVSYIPDRLDDPEVTLIQGRFTADEALKLMLGAAGVDYEWLDDRTVYAGLLTTKTLQRFEREGITKYDGMVPAEAPFTRTYPLQLDRVPIGDVIEPLSYYFGVRFLFAPSTEPLKGVEVGPLRGHFTIAQTLDNFFDTNLLTYEWVDDRTINVRRRTRSELSDVLVEAARIWLSALEQPPSRVLDRATIDRLGVSSVAQVMRYLAQQPFWRSEGLRTDGAQGVQLRGLGTDTTLVLINGHRVGTTANLYDSNSFDLNTIPVVAVERIEIYLDSTPLSIGADAIGGMVNIVLDDDAREPRFDFHYGTADSGGRERRASFTGAVRQEAFQLSAVLDHFERDRLLGSERDRWRNQDYRRFGGTDFRSADANPGNVSSMTAANLPGLPSPIAAVPRHSTGQTLSPSDFLATAGLRNMESLFAYRSVIPEAKRTSAVFGADWVVLPNWHAFAELLYTHRENVFNDFPASLSNVVVPAENPFNPFDVPVRANFLLSEIEHTRTSENDFARGLLGLRSESARWSWDFSLLRTDDHARLTTEGDLHFPNVMIALAQPDPQNALNVFDDGPGGVRSVLSNVIAPAVPRHYSSELTEITAQVRGDLFTWRAGTATALAGAQWTQSAIAAEGLPLHTPRREVTSAFAEAHVPIVARQLELPELALGLQGRIDRISDLRTIASSQFALDWRAHPNVAISATYGTSYRAPSLYDLYQPVITASARFPDPKRAGEVTNVTFTFGGNPELQVATAQSWSIGFTFTSGTPDELLVSGTLWQSDIRDRISLVDTRSVLDRDELFPGRLVRGTPTAADIVLGRPGPIVSIDMTSEGSGRLRASGVDFQASMAFNTEYGEFTPEITASWMHEFRVLEWPGLPTLQRVSRASTLGTIPRWHGVAGINWTFHALTVAAKARFISAYADRNLFQDRLTGREVEAQTLVDVQTSLQFVDEGRHSDAWRGLRVTAGIENLFDRAPQFAEIGGLFGFDPYHGDLRGRFGYLRLTKEF